MSNTTKDKTIKLRAFELKQSQLSQQFNLAEMLKTKLDSANSSNDRRMRLSEEDSNKEEDLISAYQPQGKCLCATMLRIAPGNHVQHISDKLFQKKNFSILELLDETLQTEAIYKSHYYLGVSENFLVTNLPSSTTITRAQTYINWLLGALLELTPVIEIKEEYDLSSVKSFVIQDPISTNQDIINATQKDNGSAHIFKDIQGIAIEKLKALFVETDTMKDIDLSQLISAKLMIELKKPKKDAPDDVKKAFGAILKPVSDLDNISFKTRNGVAVKGSELTKIKPVTVDVTDNGNLNEQTLFQQMERFLAELECEKNNVYSVE